VAVSAVKLEAPIPLPRRNIWCVGRNYHVHATVFKDNAANPMEWPIVFTKVPDCVVGPTDDVVLPGAQISEQIDYEAELAVVIRKGGKNIAKADWRGHIFGYTIVNDVTARDVQMRHQAAAIHQERRRDPHRDRRDRPDREQVLREAIRRQGGFGF